ncbi:hypothetical protein B0B39_00470 [Legionella longbeachae]|uniref:hypothetical protein n=1 Tax=Legionella longbeachae TaxID=450 RepID=UPI000A1C185E|nr:hypothetical protein [Legionella longbeachae]ARM32102.1 hypothetical protein B0B39_00470 [Legionella longbeachae]
MFTEEFNDVFLNKYAQQLQTYKGTTKTDGSIPLYIQGITTSLSGFIDKQSKDRDGNTFKKIAEASSNGGELFIELEQKSGKKRTWTIVFSIGALAAFRKEKMESNSPEREHLDQIIDGLNQGWVEGFGGLSLSGISINQEVINKLLGGIEGWIKNLEPNKPDVHKFSETVIAAITLISILETKLIENKSRVEGKIPNAFTILAETKKTLMLKAPQLALSHYSQDNGLLSELLEKQPAIALSFFKENPSLVGSLSPATRVTETFAAFLGNNPEFALELLRNPSLKEQQNFIISSLLKSKPEYIEPLLSSAPDSVKQILHENRNLVRAIQNWLESEEAHSKDLNTVKAFMVPYQVKTTTDALAKLQESKGAAPSLCLALEKIQQKYDESRKPFHEKQKRMAIFSKFMKQIPLNMDRFWINYPNEKKMNQLCDDLGLEPDSIQREQLLTHVRSSLGSYLNKKFNPWGPPTLPDILHSKEIEAANSKVQSDLEQSLTPFTNQKKQIHELEKELKQLDSTLPEISIDEWIGSQQQFQQSINSSDSDMPMQEIQKHAQALIHVLTSYKTEMEKIRTIALSIQTLATLGINITEISQSLEQYVEAIYQQGIKLYENKPENYSKLNIIQKIDYLENKINEQIKTTNEIKRKFGNLHKEAIISNKKSMTDKRTIAHAREVINTSSGFTHWILNIFSSSYRKTFSALRETIESYDKLATEAERNNCVPEYAAKIRNILLITESNSNKFCTMKQEIHKIQQELELPPVSLQEQDTPGTDVTSV